MNTAHPSVPADWLARITRLLETHERVLLGLAGPPGAGKSTLAAALQAHHGALAQVVPMDGFHLAQTELERLGRAQRKGAPDTFDAAGFVTLLERLRQPRAGEVVYAPAFRREIEEPLAGAIAIEHDRRLLLVEGNYLLLDTDAWAGVAPLLHEVWYVDTPPAQRLAWLLGRHRHFGRTEAQARQWIAQTDEPNARLIEGSRERATCRFCWDTRTG
jgi:pantothenate kinase